MDVTPTDPKKRDIVFKADDNINATAIIIHNVIQVENESVVTIMEFNPDKGILFTTYRHMADASVNKNDPIKSGDIIGLFRDKSEVSDIHIHIETVSIDIDKLLKKLDIKKITNDHIQTLRDIFNQFESESQDYARQASSNSIDGQFLDDTLIQYVQRIGVSDYNAVSWLSSGTSLNQYLLGAIENEALKKAHQLITAGIPVITTPAQLLAVITKGTILRDQLTLKAVKYILQQSQVLFAPLDSDVTVKLQTLTNQIQQLADDLNQKMKEQQAKILKALQTAIDGPGK